MGLDVFDPRVLIGLLLLLVTLVGFAWKTR